MLNIGPALRGGGDSFFDKVKLLLHFNGANNSTVFVDSSKYARTIATVGDAKLSTAAAKFGQSGGLFDGNGDRLDFDSATDWNFAGSYTIEMWLQFTAVGAYQYIFALSKTVGGTDSYIYTVPSNKLNFYCAGSIITGSTTITTGQWYHVAACYEAGVAARLFVNGVLDGVISGTRLPLLVDRAFIGSPISGFGSATDGFRGYMDEVRVTDGVARYTSAFTPPAAPFSDY